MIYSPDIDHNRVPIYTTQVVKEIFWYELRNLDRTDRCVNQYLHATWESVNNAQEIILFFLSQKDAL